MSPRQVGTPPTREGPVTMADSVARRLADQANAAPYDPEKATKLAWRPAWSIRSRRGAWRALRELLGREQ